MSLMNHALGFLYGGHPKDYKLQPGWTITKVQWDGCMANVRKEIERGDFVRYEDRMLHGDRKATQGIVIRWDSKPDKDDWWPLSRFSVRGGEAEVWE